MGTCTCNIGSTETAILYLLVFWHRFHGDSIRLRSWRRI